MPDKVNDSRLKFGVNSADTIQRRAESSDLATITRLYARPPGPVYTNLFQGD
jgi:hypothetical protein